MRIRALSGPCIGIETVYLVTAFFSPCIGVAVLTHRERMETVLRRVLPDRVPMVARLDIWHTARVSEGSVPAEVAGLSLWEIEQRLHMGRSARFRNFHSEERDGVTEIVQRDADRTIHAMEIGGRSIRQVELVTPELESKGMQGQLREHYLKSPDDYRTMIRIWERTRFVADHDACRRFNRDTGDAGMPMLILPTIPIHRIMLDYAGYGNFYFHQADFPDLVDELCRVMESAYEAFWGELAACDLNWILHGAHWSSQMTPPALFEEKFLPYLTRFTNAVHTAGKKCAFHADADLSALLDLVLATGMDVAECFACAPLVPLTLARARERLGDRVVIWGGFPATLLEPSATDRQFHEYLGAFAEEISDGRSIIVGVSDNVMPDALWERIVELAERVSHIRPEVLSSERKLG